MELNLDEARAARAEVEGEPERHVLTFKGEAFEMPVELPVGLLEHLAQYLVLTQGGKVVPVEDAAAMSGSVDHLLASCEVIFGPEQWARIKVLGADFKDVLAILTFVIRAYRLGESGDAKPETVVGESPASGSSSSDSGGDSRPTGNGSTDGTSDETSTEEGSVSAGSASS